MKYNEKNKPLQCFMTNSTCYKKTKLMTPKGILWHCTGANNPNLKRYVQPSENDKNYSNIINILGKNIAKNDWNHINRQAGLNAWIGLDAQNQVRTVQTMPWNYRPWGCGTGSKGSCNDGWIQFEICEDSLTDEVYFNAVYKEACELTAYLCKIYNINPNGIVNKNNIKVPTILCHQDSYKLGLGNNHGDVYNWFNVFGKTMNDVRNDVMQILSLSRLEEEEVTQTQFNEMMNVYLKSVAAKDGSTWSEEARDWALEKGFITGDGAGNYQWKANVTREQLVTILKRALGE